ncbi:MAG: dihydroorotase [Candidatus Competibacterales bacterium]|nr:dihydroorotase [Candidatus Competibacterales bacterium]
MSNSSPACLTLTRPDDWHLHLRDGELLAAILPYSARRFARALVMPNLVPPIATTAQALAYRDHILAALPAGMDFEPLMSLYLTDRTEPLEIVRAKLSGHVLAAKLYPAGATTHSAAGITAIEVLYPVLDAMQEHDLVLCVHGEVTDPRTDIFDREAAFIDRVLEPLVGRFPALRVVLEHVTTREGIDFVRAAPGRVAATLTPQHLRHNRNTLFRGGLRPHHYCLPVLKRETHRQALVEAATSGDPRFFLGTDSAPHRRHDKESDCGCAGCFSAPAALEFYAELFAQAGALDRLECFASHHGADFYGLPRNQGTVTLVREPWDIPELVACCGDSLVPLDAGETLGWRLTD